MRGRPLSQPKAEATAEVWYIPTHVNQATPRPLWLRPYHGQPVWSFWLLCAAMGTIVGIASRPFLPL